MVPRFASMFESVWSWGGLGAVGIAGDTGLYMGSDFTNIEIAERDILNNSDAESVFKGTFAQQYAPVKDNLLNAVGYNGKFRDPSLMNHYRLQSGCARPPYGRWHKSSLNKATVDMVYLREPNADGIIEIQDEAIYSYCESINNDDDDPVYVYCADDPFHMKTGVQQCKEDRSKLRLRFLGCLG